MPKIIFVSIILLSGLFSLQKQISSSMQQYVKEKPQPELIHIQAVKQSPKEDFSVMYIFPEDSEVPVCPVVPKEHISL